MILFLKSNAFLLCQQLKKECSGILPNEYSDALSKQQGNTSPCTFITAPLHTLQQWFVCFPLSLYLPSTVFLYRAYLLFVVKKLLPFSKSFIYRGTDFEASNLSSHYQGNIHMSLPMVFKLSYQFNSGKNRDKINRAKEEIDAVPKRGFWFLNLYVYLKILF